MEQQFQELRKATGKVLSTYFDKNRLGKDRINVVIDNNGNELYLTSIKLANELKSLKEGQILEVEYFENGQFNNVVAAKVKKTKTDNCSLVVSVDDPELALAAMQFEWHRRMKIFWKTDKGIVALKDMSMNELTNAIEILEKTMLKNEEDNLK